MADERPFINFHRPCIGDEEIEEVVACIRSGWLTTGSRARRFEEDFKNYIGAKFAVAMNSCTAALHLALEAIGLQAGDLVLVPTMTFGATAEVVRYFDAIPVFVDSNPDDFCMDMGHAAQILEKIASSSEIKGLKTKSARRVKAIIPVHFGGRPADIVNCKKLCRNFDLRLIEDCAHVCPAYYRREDGTNAMAGSEADIACYSFYANKTITTGEGGMATTDNEAWADRMRVMSLHGISKDAWKRFTRSGSWFYEIVAPGYKYNITDIAASIGIHQLRKADIFFQERRRIAALYDSIFGKEEDIAIVSERAGTSSSCHLYCIRVPAKIRNTLIEDLKERAIGTSVHYVPLHMHPYYRERYGFSEGDFPVSEKLYSESVSLPIYPGLGDSEIEYIAGNVISCVKKLLAKGCGA